MPFTSDWIERTITTALKENRLAHAYLLTGADMDKLEELLDRLATILLGAEPKGHHDFHTVKPESKSRRIVIEQIRDLEQALRLKPHTAPRKVAALIAAERMCLGSAEPANAFLKTLEEPPAQTTLFLLSEHPETLLPTIRSRCLPLTLAGGEQVDEFAQHLAKSWVAVKGTPAEIAYTRASMLGSFWQTERAKAEEIFAQNDPDDETDKNTKAAVIESQVRLAQEKSIAALISTLWKSRAEDDLEIEPLERALLALEDLRVSLARNMDQGLALERCCLRISGLL